MVVAPDVQNAHKQDTERYVLTNLNIVRHVVDRTVQQLVCADLGTAWDLGPTHAYLKRLNHLQRLSIWDTSDGAGKKGWKDKLICLFGFIQHDGMDQRDITPYRAHAHARYSSIESCPRARFSDFFPMHFG